MFLFKLTLPVLGTATLGSVGTGIYYGVDSWKRNGGGETAQTSKNKSEANREALQQPDSSSKSPSLPVSPQTPTPTDPDSEETTTAPSTEIQSD